MILKSHIAFFAALILGVGIILVTISGVAWRMTTADAHQCTDFGRCGRRQCGRGNTSFGLLYPEFQHRPPPPSYSASMQQYRLRYFEFSHFFSNLIFPQKALGNLK